MSNLLKRLPTSFTAQIKIHCGIRKENLLSIVDGKCCKFDNLIRLAETISLKTRLKKFSPSPRPRGKSTTRKPRQNVLTSRRFYKDLYISK